MGGFDDLLDDIEGTGWYQKRLVYFLMGPLFFLMPFAFLNQIFVLTIPDHWCTPPDHVKPENFNISLEEWKMKFLPMELGPDYQPRPSQCSMFNVTVDNLPKF